MSEFIPSPVHTEFTEKLALAERMIPLIGQLHRENNVDLSVFGRLLAHPSPIDIIKSHRHARRITDEELSLEATFAVIAQLTQLNLGTASIDVGRLASDFAEETGTTPDRAEVSELRRYLAGQLAPVVDSGATPHRTDVVLYGFGRIGRLLARLLLQRESLQRGVRLRAIVVRKNGENDLLKRADLLRRDSVHGPFEGTVSVDTDNNVLWANGTAIQVIYSNDPSEVDYSAYGIEDAVVVDNTGKWRGEEGLSKHLGRPGVSKVVLTAPGKGSLTNVVYGINHEAAAGKDIVSAASCTTNAITPVLKVINDRYGVVHGHVETAHSYTNDQNLIDNFHKGARRGRAAGLNMVLTETGAAKAVAKALPELEGKLTGNAIRVPTPDVSMAVLNLTLEKPAERDEVNEYLKRISLVSELRQQIDYVESPEVVSNDFVGSTHAGVVDGLATIADGKNLVLYVWYDNEFGYSNQVVRLVEEIAGSRPVVLPERVKVADV